MRIGILRDRRAVSNALAYVFSFTIATLVMTSSVIITRNIIEDKTADVAGLEAQSLANKIADSLLEAVANMKARPESGFDKVLDIPRDLAGRQYYIEVTDSMVYVNTTDGAVSKSCTTYNIEGLNIGATSGGKIYSGISEIKLSFDEPDYVYKFDFGTGNSSYHSPIESGYQLVSEETEISSREPGWFGSPSDPDGYYSHRIPILVNNTSPDDLIDVPVQVTLNPSNFDYSNTNVTYPDGSSSKVFSDLVFVDSLSAATAGISISPETWSVSWLYKETTFKVNVVINTLSDGYTRSDIDLSDLDAFKLNGQVSAVDYVRVPAVGEPVIYLALRFDRQEAVQSLGGDPPQGQYTVSFSGPFKDGTMFYGKDDIYIGGDILFVDDDNPAYYTTIQDAVDAATDSDTIFVYGGVYQGSALGDPSVKINKRINLIGDKNDIPIIKGALSSGSGTWTAVRVYSSGSQSNIDGFKITDCHSQAFWLSGCDDVTVENCEIYDNECKGVYISDDAERNILRNCDIHDNSNTTGVNPASGIVILGSAGTPSYNQIINCDIYNHYDSYGSGVRIEEGANHNKIINCNIWDNTGIDGDGIQIYDKTNDNTDYNEIINCTIWGHESDGVELTGYNTWGPVYNIIRDCEIYGNEGAGIYFNRSGFNDIIGCTIYNNLHTGIFLYFSDNNNIENTILYGTVGGIGEDSGTGIKIDESASGNTIEDCVVIDNSNRNIHIEDKVGTISGDTYGNSIINCVIANSGAMGVYIEGSEDNLVEGCDVYGNADFGICIKDNLFGKNPRYNDIIDCAVYDNGYGGDLAETDGIRLELGANNNTIYNCDIFRNKDDGIQIQNPDAQKNNIQYCDLFDNGGSGIYINLSQTYIPNNPNNVIEYCNFYSNEYGIYMNGYIGDPLYIEVPTRKNIIRYCNFYSNNKYGIRLQRGSDYNTIHHNNFEGNELGNAYQSTLADNNDWDDGSTGNYWDDFPNGPCGYSTLYYQIYPGCDFTAYDDDPVGSKFANREPDIVFVDDSYTSDELDKYHVKTIREGIDNVNGSSLNLGLVYIYNGTYNTASGNSFPIEIEDKDNICIIGESRDGVVVDSTGSGENTFNVGVIASCTTLVLDSLTIKGDGVGVYSYCPPPCNEGFICNPKEYVVISNCSIKNNNIGISFDQGYCIVTNCEINNNAQDGIRIGTYTNSVTYCDIYNNNGNGLNLDGAGYTDVIGCDIHDNGDGVELQNSGSNPSNRNEFIDCMIHDNNDNGVNMYSASNYNLFSNCDVYDNSDDGFYLTGVSFNNITKCSISGNQDYGVRIESSSGNTIYQNVFADNDLGNAFDNNIQLYGNRWNSSYNKDTSQNNGNRWDDYYDASDGAFDYYSGPNQDEQGSDGIIDEPYNITGGNNRDMLPLGGSKKIEVRPYFIDYWNPDGESLIYVKMSLNGNQRKYVYLYYGYTGELQTGDLGIHSHSIGEITMFFDDFAYTSDISDGIWTTIGTPATDGKGNITFYPNDCIITNNVIIPEFQTPDPPVLSTSTNEVMYVVETKMKINNNSQANMILLSQDSTSLDESYCVSVDQFPKKLLFYKYRPGFIEIVKETPLQSINRWLRLKSYIYLSKTCNRPSSDDSYYVNASLINGFLSDFDTFAFEDNISCLDTFWEGDGVANDPPDANNEAVGPPYLSGRVGLGCSLQSGANRGNVTVDWIRVMKEPVTPPTVVIGSMEGIKYGWNSSSISSWNFPNKDPYNPGPVLCDINYGAANEAAPAVFEIKNLPNNRYTVTAVIGGFIDDGGCGGWDGVKIKLESGETLLTFSGDGNGEYRTKWATIDWSGGDLKLNIVGYGSSHSPNIFEAVCINNFWYLNSMLIERGDKGVLISPR